MQPSPAVAWPSVKLASLHYSSLTSAGADSCVNIVGMISTPSQLQ